MKKMNLQFFAESAGSAAGTEPTAGAQGQQALPATGQQTTVPQIDYGKIQQMLDGTLQAKAVSYTHLDVYERQTGRNGDLPETYLLIVRIRRQSWS